MLDLLANATAIAGRWGATTAHMDAKCGSKRRASRRAVETAACARLSPQQKGMFSCAVGAQSKLDRLVGAANSAELLGECRAVGSGSSKLHQRIVYNHAHLWGRVCCTRADIANLGRRMWSNGPHPPAPAMQIVVNRLLASVNMRSIWATMSPPIAQTEVAGRRSFVQFMLDPPTCFRPTGEKALLATMPFVPSAARRIVRLNGPAGLCSDASSACVQPRQFHGPNHCVVHIVLRDTLGGSSHLPHGGGMRWTRSAAAVIN